MQKKKKRLRGGGWGEEKHISIDNDARISSSKDVISFLLAELRADKLETDIEEMAKESDFLCTVFFRLYAKTLGRDYRLIRFLESLEETGDGLPSESEE